MTTNRDLDLSLSLISFPLVADDNNEPRGSSLFFGFIPQLPTIMPNWDPSSLSSLVFFSSIVENNNKPFGLFSFLTCFSSITEEDNEPLDELRGSSSPSLGFFLKCKRR